MKCTLSLFVVSLSLAIGQPLNAQPRQQRETGSAWTTQTAAENPLAHPESVLAPLWPLQKERRKLQRMITELELMLVDAKQRLKIPADARPEVKKRLEDENQRSAGKARQSQDRIDAIQLELDSVNRRMALVKKKAQIEGLVNAVDDSRIVEISVGHDDGVRRGMLFHVFADQTSIALLEITKVAVDKSHARILEQDAETPVRASQRAVMLLDDRVLSEIIGHDPGQPIYNDRLQRFKFQLERIEITDGLEFAEHFWFAYKGRGNPPIMGVWGDPRTNSLVVVAPPDADQAIRNTLAEMQQRQVTGIDVRDDDPLEALQSQIHIRFRHALETVTRTKLEIIDAEASGENPDGERLRKLKLDLENGTKGLETIERKLTLISESLRRLQNATHEEH